MKAIISSEVLAQEGLTLQDFGVLLYYIDHGHGDICPEITDKLWNKNLLTKEIDGYSYNAYRNKQVKNWLINSEETKPKAPTKAEIARFTALANKLRELYPSGTKDGKYSWRDNTGTITSKLQTLYTKFNCDFTDEEAVEATKSYVARFQQAGSFQYMQLLKYFILKRDIERSEETSTLLTIIQNKREAPNSDEIVDMFSGNHDIGELK